VLSGSFIPESKQILKQMKSPVLIFLIVILLGFSAFGQRNLIVESKVIVINPIDTLNLKVIYQTNLFRPKEINETFFNGGINYIEDGERKSIPTRRLLSFEFVDSCKYVHKRKFVNSRLVNNTINKESRPYQESSTMVEEIVTGKINWYISYSIHFYDGSIVESNLFIKDGEWDNWANFRSVKKTLIKLMSDRPDLVEKIKNTKFPGNQDKVIPIAIDYLRQYNQQ